MSNFFELPHIFVVFPPGAGGNFIAGLLAKIVNKDLKNLELSDSGNAHLNSPSKINFTDVISCGLIYNMPKFSYYEEKLQFYKTEIEKKHGSDTDIKVAWSHDFSNIDLYKTIFPNCKILVITQYDNKEKLAALIQQELKNRLDPNGFVFLEKNAYVEIWRDALRKGLTIALGQGKTATVSEITDNYLDIKYRPLVTFLAINIMIRFYGQEHLIDTSKQMTFDYLNYCTVPRFVDDADYIPKESDHILFNIGPAYKDCITDDCIVMPYAVIMNKDLPSLLNIIGTIVDDLDSEEIEFVKSNLDNYHTKQSPGLMDDPFKYYFSLARDAQNQIKCLIKN